MITIKNTQKTISVDVDLLYKDTQKILDLLDYHDFDIGILLTTNKVMQKYNREYRDKDKPTDILSFPFHQIVAGERIIATSADEKNLGDIIIAPQYVMDDLERWGQTFDQRMRILLVHGICHLLGYDHIKDEDYTVMKAQEEWLLKQLN
ncbi:MAG TPA: rRNA maturation RNase YbeY [Candidatus Dependentiae bacterium]|nr:rRNA maturation RNase YbeY [Candidatus Dependentiae bacterium]HRQ62958.1 rRNA maturation RNase YbeY [Candidatus Dependentiae bacterium]